MTIEQKLTFWWARTKLLEAGWAWEEVRAMSLRDVLLEAQLAIAAGTAAGTAL